MKPLFSASKLVEQLLPSTSHSSGHSTSALHYPGDDDELRVSKHAANHDVITVDQVLALFAHTPPTSHSER